MLVIHLFKNKKNKNKTTDWEQFFLLLYHLFIKLLKKNKKI